MNEPVVVRDHDRRVKRLEINDDERVRVECRLGFQNERQCFRSTLVCNLLLARRKHDEIARLGDARHYRFDLELRASRDDRVEIDTKDPSKLGGSADEVRVFEKLQVLLYAIEVIGKCSSFDWVRPVVPLCQLRKGEVRDSKKSKGSAT